jgi:hypothetical protein
VITCLHVIRYYIVKLSSCSINAFRKSLKPLPTRKLQLETTQHVTKSTGPSAVQDSTSWIPAKQAMAYSTFCRNEQDAPENNEILTASPRDTTTNCWSAGLEYPQVNKPRNSSLGVVFEPGNTQSPRHVKTTSLTTKAHEEVKEKVNTRHDASKVYRLLR